MADVPVLNSAEGEAAPQKSKKWLIIAIIAVLVLAGGGVAAWLLLGNKGPHDKKAVAKAKEPPAPALYLALDPPFVVNFEGDQSVRFLQITVQIMTRKPE